MLTKIESLKLMRSNFVAISFWSMQEPLTKTSTHAEFNPRFALAYFRKLFSNNALKSALLCLSITHHEYWHRCADATRYFDAEALFNGSSRTTINGRVLAQDLPATPEKRPVWPPIDACLNPNSLISWDHLLECIISRKRIEWSITFDDAHEPPSTP